MVLSERRVVASLQVGVHEMGENGVVALTLQDHHREFGHAMIAPSEECVTSSKRNVVLVPKSSRASRFRVDLWDSDGSVEPGVDNCCGVQWVVVL